MKKSLSLLLSGAMVMGSFASVAFAADTTTTAPTTTAAPTTPATPPTTQQMYDALAAKGIFSGVNANGDAGLDLKMTRAQFARAAALVRGLEGIGNPDTLVVTSAPFKDVPVGKWFTEEVQAVKAAGLMVGNANGTFNPNGNITVQELAVVTAQLLGLKAVDGSSVTGAASWAAGYIKVLADNGVSFPTNYKENATRAQLVGVAYQAYNAVQAAKIAPVSAKVIDANNVEVTFSDKAVEKVVLKDALVANKETEITVTHNGKDYKYKVTYVVTSATKVESVSATNLKEIVVKFDGEVDQTSAEDKDKYTVTAGALKSAVLSADKKTVTLTLADGTAMVNQTKYKVTVTNVKAGTSTVSAKDVEFMPLDNVLPTVSSVTSLGNKAIKVVFSEPVKANSYSTNFTLDGAPFYGSVSTNGNELVLKPYSGSVAVGAHKLGVSLVEDFAGLKSLPSTTDFTVVEDKDGPTVVSNDSTLERVVVTFNEDIDPATIAASDLYWLSGSTKMYASTATALAGNKVEFDFTGSNTLPGYELPLYLDSVSDYSGNVNATKNFQVQAKVDQVRPEVVEVKLATGAQSFTVRYSKAVTATGIDKSKYTLTDKDGYVVGIKNVAPADTAGKLFTVNLYGPLGTGNNTLKIAGVQDMTALHNTMLDYSTVLNVGDTTGPLYQALSANNATRSIVISFDEALDLATATNHSNYLIRFNGNLTVLPDDVQIFPVLNGTGVRLVFPEYIGTTPVTFGVSPLGTVSKIQVSNMKDVAGNVQQNFTSNEQPTVVSPAVVVTGGIELVDQNTINVKFDQPIGVADTNDFMVTANFTGSFVPVAIASVTTDGSPTVVIKTTTKLGTDVAKVKVAIDNAASSSFPTSTQNITTVTGNPAALQAATSPVDKVGPVLLTTTANVAAISATSDVTLTFSEILTGVQEAYGIDLDIKQVGAGVKTLSNGVDYTTAHGGTNEVLVHFNTPIAAASYTIAVKADAVAIQDAATNKASASDVVEVAGTAFPAVANASAVAADKAATNITFTGAETASTVKGNVTLVPSATNGSATTWTSTNTAVSIAGVVTRPIYSAGDATGNLTAAITKGAASDTKAFALTVLKKDFTAVAAATPDATFTVTGDGYTAGTSNDIDVAQVTGTGIATINGVTFAVTVNATGKFTVGATGTWAAAQSADATKTILVTKDGKTVTLHLNIVAGAMAGTPVFTVIN